MFVYAQRRAAGRRQPPLDGPGFDACCEDAGGAAGLANIGNAALVSVVARCLTGRWWETQQTSSPQHWCRVILGVSEATARKLVRVAGELADYPKVAATFTAGRMTLDQVEVIVTNAHPMYDPILVDAGRWDIGRMRRIIANFEHPKPQPDPTPAGEDEPAPVPDPEPRDEWRAGWGDDGRYRGSFDLGAELGSLLDRAMATARDRLFPRSSSTSTPSTPTAPTSTSAPSCPPRSAGNSPATPTSAPSSRSRASPWRPGAAAGSSTGSSACSSKTATAAAASRAATAPATSTSTTSGTGKTAARRSPQTSSPSAPSTTD